MRSRPISHPSLLQTHNPKLGKEKPAEALKPPVLEKRLGVWLSRGRVSDACVFPSAPAPHRNALLQLLRFLCFYLLNFRFFPSAF